MILASFDHAEDDLNQRQLIEATNEANTIKEAVEKGQKHPAWQQLTPNEIEKIHSELIELDASIKGQDYKLIRAAIDRLDKATTRFAELMMDTAVSSALTGKTMGAAGDDLGTGPSAPHPFAPAQIDDSKKG
jgi:molecular chaperone DnaK/molecular chaperone HscA